MKDRCSITKGTIIFASFLKNHFKIRRVAMQNKLLHKNVSAAFLSMLVLCVAAISLATQGLAQGEVYRPPNPVMDYVPQNIGIKDKPYRDFTELDCRECHGENTAVRHHNTEPAMMGKCLYSQGGCHDSGLPGYIERDCQICHTSNPNVYPEFYAVWGDLGNPHHKTDLANTGQCNQCHDPNLVVEAYSVPPPIYAPGRTTPTPASPPMFRTRSSARCRRPSS